MKLTITSQKFDILSKSFAFFEKRGPGFVFGNFLNIFHNFLHSDSNIVANEFVKTRKSRATHGSEDHIEHLVR